MSAIVFLGPSLRVDAAQALLAADYRPPASQGDVYRAALEGPRAIGVVDGYFERVPAVWHKEILWAMARGIRVFGAASMGALRAAELASFGMVGVGAVFEAYRDGVIEDDDEVAVTHGPAAVGYPAVSEAMVNIRATLQRADAEGVIDASTALRLTAIAKDLFYAERSYERVLAIGAAERLPATALSAFAHWLPSGRVDRKGEDARTMLVAIGALLDGDVLPLKVDYVFQRTDAWEQVTRRAGRQVAAAMPDALPPDVLLEELRIDADTYRHTMAAACARALALHEAERQGVTVDRARFREVLNAFFVRRDMRTPEAIVAWMTEQGLNAEGLTTLVEHETRVTQVEALFRNEILAQVPDVLRACGRYGAVARRAEAKQRWLDANALQGAGLEEAGVGEAELLHWHFTTRHGRPVPADLDGHAQSVGFANRFALLQALLRDWLYCRESGGR